MNTANLSFLTAPPGNRNLTAAGFQPSPPPFNQLFRPVLQLNRWPFTLLIFIPSSLPSAVHPNSCTGCQRRLGAFSVPTWSNKRPFEGSPAKQSWWWWCNKLNWGYVNLHGLSPSCGDWTWRWRLHCSQYTSSSATCSIAMLVEKVTFLATLG